MAAILLEPSEAFAHRHDESSYTLHIYGSVEFSTGAATHLMQQGEKFFVPPNTPHTIKNVGSSVARVDCLHGPEPHPTADRLAQVKPSIDIADND
jgi:quercetin dioxygenase-like cupin family protein